MIRKKDWLDAVKQLAIHEIALEGLIDNRAMLYSFLDDYYGGSQTPTAKQVFTRVKEIAEESSSRVGRNDLLEYAINPQK